MARKKKQMAGQGELNFRVLKDDELSYLKSAIRAQRAEDRQWRGAFAVPPGSLLDDIITQFQANTNIPLEIPFTTFLHYLGAWLLQRDVRVTVGEGEYSRAVLMDFWTVVLAASGAGKTWTQKELATGLGEVAPRIGSSVSAAAFVEELEHSPKALWIRDEFLQLLKQIEQPGSPMAEVKDYLLRIHDNENIRRTTKKYDIDIHEPALSILGFNVDATFINGMSVESLVDGFAQRFSYVFAGKDPARPFQNYAFWTLNASSWAEKWNRMTGKILDRYTSGGVELFSKRFKDLAGDDVEESYYRRVLWRAHKYALLYHIICGRGDNPNLDEADYGWAYRLIAMQLSDAGRLIQECSSSDIGKLVDKAENLQRKWHKSGKGEVTPRDLVLYVRGIRNVAEARFVLEVMQK